MLCNYHTHTARCKHASGTAREYAQAAVAAGMRLLGFSDHTPYDYHGHSYHPKVRMSAQELGGYCDELRALRDEFAGQLEVRIGLEAEFCPELFPWLLEDARRHGMEYLILGQHFLAEDPDPTYFGRATEDETRLDRYVGLCIDGLQTGLFSCLAHPDLLPFEGGGALYTRQMRRLCRAAKDCGVPLEINLLGLHTGRAYPTERFWRIAAEEGNAVLLGWDAHAPERLLIPETEAAARALADRCGITLLESIDLRPL